MSVEVYEDPIISLANDPDLNKSKEKSNDLIRLINQFPLTERRVSKLCQLSLNILQTLEKVELNLKNWAFMSLDFNSGDHFKHDNSDNIKQFNTSVSFKVLQDCTDLNRKLSRISVDLDHITKASRTLSPIDCILDSGTLLTSLSLRNIKLKHELTDKVTVAYLKAKLITIGDELETMLNDGGNDSGAYYKTFVANLLSQLNRSIDDEDMEEKYECLAVINDMEKMFEAFKLEHLRQKQQEDQQKQQQKQQHDEQQQQSLEVPHHSKSHTSPPPAFDAYDEDYSDSDLQSSTFSTFNPPMVHSISKSHASTSSPLTQRQRSDSYSSLNSSMLHKTTLSEEMPYLMTAFNLAKNFEEDLKHLRDDETDSDETKKNPSKHEKPPKQNQNRPSRHLHHLTHFNVPQTPLTSESFIRTPATTPSPSYLYSNNSLLSKLGIKPRVITTDLPGNDNNQDDDKKKNYELKQDNKENLMNLTENNLKRLSASSEFEDYVE